MLSHFDGYFCSESDYRARLELVASWENVTIDTGALTYLQTYPFAKAQERLQQALEVVGADKIASGSDYPRPQLHADNSFKQQLEFITSECRFLSVEQRDQILFRTALRVYKWQTVM